ncbi:phosphate system positive regulatory protein pho81 [Dispira simplex]|nr:phosphate system positive regulatory protein pho81 [Dispira simplex]
MKFGKYIQNHRLAEWSGHYMNYKALKKIINSLGTSQQHFQFTKTAFFYQLERELEKVNEFYMQKETDLKLRLRTLLEKKKVLFLRPPNQVYRTLFLALKEAFAQFQHDLDKLQQFVEINGTGFRKILKKWDKRSKSTTKELYLSRQVEVQPCFNRDVIGELSDTATTQLAELLTKIDELPDSSATASLVLSTTALHSPSDSPDTITATPSHTFYGKSEPQLYEALLNDRQSVIQDMLDRHQARPTTSLSLPASPVDSPSSSSANIYRCFSALFWRACSEGLWNDSMELVARSGLVDFTFADDINDRTCLHQAAIHGLVGLEQVLVAIHRLNDIDHVDYYGRTALHYAAMHGRVDFLSLLLQSAPQMDLSTVDHDGNDALIYAVLRGSIPCVAVLLEHRQASKPYNYHHALILSCQYGHLDMVALILAKGVRLTLDTEDTSLLHIAAREGHPALCRLLIEHGAKVNIQDKDNTWTPLFYAANEGHQETVQVLLDAGCRLDLLDEAGSTPVYYAAVNGHVNVVGLLHQAGSRVPLPQSDQTSTVTTITTNTTTVSSALTDASQLPVSTSFMPGDILSTSRDVTAFFQASPSRPLESAPFNDGHMDKSHSFTLPDSVHDIDMDGIPSLSLPPPVIPVRTYGHRYLDDKCYLQLLFRNQSSPTRHSPVQIQGYTELSTLRLMISPKPDQGVILRTLMLPLDEDPSVVGFLLPRDAPFNIEFSVYPSFGSKLLGKAVVLGASLGLATHQDSPLPTNLAISTGSGVVTSVPTPAEAHSLTSIDKPARLQSNHSHGSIVCPLLNTHLKVVGEIALGYVLIKPLDGVKLQIGGPVPTYWKSTNTTHPQHSVGSILNSPLSTLSVGPTSSRVVSPAFPTVPAAYLSGGADNRSSGPDTSTMFALKAPDEASHSSNISNPTDSVKSKLGRSRSGSGTPLTQPHAPPTLVSGTPLIALVTSSSLANEHVHLIVQVTRDFIPVVYPWSQLNIIDGVQLSITAMTAAQFRHVGLQKLGFVGKNTVDAEEKNDVDAHLLARIRHINHGAVPQTTQDWHRALHCGFFTLVEVFQLLPLAMGISIELKYPYSPVSLPEAGSTEILSAAVSPTVASAQIYPASGRPLTVRVGRGVGTDGPDINQYVDAVLHTVYTSVPDERNAASTGAENTTKPSPHPAAASKGKIWPGKIREQRNIFFSSFHPGVCTALNWKQPNYPVFFSTMCGSALPALVDDDTYAPGSENSQGKLYDMSKPSWNPLLAPENQSKEDKSEGVTIQVKRPRNCATTDSHAEYPMEWNEVDQPSEQAGTLDTIDETHCFREDGPLTRSSLAMSLTNPASIKDAIRYSRRNHLLGLLCDAQLLVRVPSLITTIKQSGLVLATFGQANCFPENLELQKLYGVDAILAKGVFRYNRSDPMENV